MVDKALRARVSIGFLMVDFVVVEFLEVCCLMIEQNLQLVHFVEHFEDSKCPVVFSPAGLVFSDV